MIRRVFVMQRTKKTRTSAFVRSVVKNTWVFTSSLLAPNLGPGTLLVALTHPTFASD